MFPFLFFFLFKSGFTSAFLGEFQRELNSAVLKDMRSNKDNISVTVLAVDITRKESEYQGYYPVILLLLYVCKIQTFHIKRMIQVSHTVLMLR